MTPLDRLPGPRGVGANARAVIGLVNDPCPSLDALSHQFGQFFEVRAGPKRLVVVGDPALVAELVMLDVGNFRWGRVGSVLRIVIGPTSMILSDGEDHRRRRSLAQPGFARRRLDRWMPLILTETDRMIDDLTTDRGRAPMVDLYLEMRSLIRRIVVRVLFGEDLGERADEIGELLEPAMLFAGGPPVRQMPVPLPFGPRHRAAASRRAVDRLLDEEIDRRRRSPSVTDGGLLDGLLVADDGAGPMSDAEIRDQIVTLIGAGYDTTSAALSWAIARSARDPGLWGRLGDEAAELIDSAVGSSDTTRLPWAAATVHESLRLHPAGPFSPREVVREVKLGPAALRPGTIVMWSPHLMGRDPAAWEQPLEFRPERFIDKPADPVRDLAWLPFGRGPRRCIGFALAQMEMVLVLARMAQRLDVALVSDELPRPTGVVVARPSGGLPARVSISERGPRP